MRAPMMRMTSVAGVDTQVQVQTVIQQLAAIPTRQYIMVSGKGGVGKTSLSASLAVKLAMEGHCVLVVSTDPAHSLGDSLDQDLGGGKPVRLGGTDLEVWGMEIDIEAAKREFQAVAASPRTQQEAEGLFGSVGLTELVSKLVDLNLAEVLNTPPPGFDEGVAISKVVDFVEKEEYAKFTRIVVDTAPTGHTLRLLQLPEFLEAAIGKIVRLRRKIGQSGGMVQGLFNLTGAEERLNSAAAKLEVWQEKLHKVGQLFRDPTRMEFIIAGIPTVLSVRESGRLLEALRKGDVPCKRVITNQLVSETNGETYIKMKLQAQKQSLAELAQAPQVAGLEIIKAPLVDLEIRGVPALRYFGDTVWRQGRLPAWEAMQQPTSKGPRRFYLLGGKGGVGKTSLSASLAVQFAAEGHSTLVVSTDPAHSLGDALAQALAGGEPLKVTEAVDLPLYAMEISPEEARAEMRSFAKSGGSEKLEDWLGGVGLGSLAAELKDLQLGQLLDTLPPGADEAIAISKVVKFLKDPKFAHFDRILFDTAPSGHTLRLLGLPDFLDQTIGKVLRLRQSLQNTTGALSSFFTGQEQKKSDLDVAVAKLEEVKERLQEAKALFRDVEQTEFIVVTIPTVMATRESCRLIDALRKEGVPVKRLCVNQILPEANTEAFLRRRRADQSAALRLLSEDPGLSKLQQLNAPLLDLEVRGLMALRYFGGLVWDQPAAPPK